MKNADMIRLNSIRTIQLNVSFPVDFNCVSATKLGRRLV